MDGQIPGHSGAGSARLDAGTSEAGSDVADSGGPGTSADAGSSGTIASKCEDAEPTDDLQKPVELATDLHVGVGMSAIAVHGADVFFITNESAIMRTTTRGAVPIEVTTRAIPTTGLTIDGDYLYWLAGDYDNGKLERMPLAGGDVESFGRARSVAARENVIAFAEGNVYWTDFDLDDATVGGRIMRMPKEGGAAEPLITGRPGVPFSIATDGTEMFWSESASLEALATTRIMAMPLEGGDVRLVGRTIAGSGDIAVDAEMVYFGSSESDDPSAGLFRMDKAGGDPRLIARGGFAPAIHLVLDETHIYWGGEGMMKATKDGCHVMTLVAIVGGACTGITADAQNVYYTNPFAGGDSGKVLRLTK